MSEERNEHLDICAKIQCSCVFLYYFPALQNYSHRKKLLEIYGTNLMILCVSLSLP